MPLKIIGCVLIAAAGFYIGYLQSLKLHRRKNFLDRLSVFAQLLSTNIRFNSGDVFSVVNVSADESELKLLNVERDEKLSFEYSWNKSVNKLPKKLGLLNSDKELLTELGKELGKTDVEGQLRFIQLFSERLALFRNEAREALVQKTKLYRAMGFFLGATLALLVI